MGNLLKHSINEKSLFKDISHLIESAQQQTLQALEGARHFLKRQIALRLNLYRVPELHFEADVERADTTRMSDLLKRIRRGRPRDQAHPQA